MEQLAIQELGGDWSQAESQSVPVPKERQGTETY